MLKVIRFTAPWCQPCKILGPVMDAVAAENTDVEFQIVNVEERGDIAGQYQIMGVPVVVFIKDDKEVDRFSGTQPKQFVDRIVNMFK